MRDQNWPVRMRVRAKAVAMTFQFVVCVVHPVYKSEKQNKTLTVWNTNSGR